MSWETRQRGGVGATADRDGSGRSPAPAPGKSTLTGQLQFKTAASGAVAVDGEHGKHVDPRPEGAASPAGTKDDSARFDNDVVLDGVSKGIAEVKQGDRGVDVTKVQQALIDLGYLLPICGGVPRDDPRRRQPDRSMGGRGES